MNPINIPSDTQRHRPIKININICSTVFAN